MHDAKTLAAELRAEGELLARQPELGEAFREGTCIFRAADALERLAEAERERDRLRAVISKVCAALPNGAFCSPECTIEFMEHVPAEVSGVLSALQEEVGRLTRAVEFVARMAWRTDPPHANVKLTDAERLSAIKYHPTINKLGEPHRELADREALARTAGGKDA